MRAMTWCVSALCGLTAGAAFGGAMLALGVLTRMISMFGGQARHGWVVALGAGAAAFMYMSGWSLGLGAWAGWLLLIIGGAFVGMTSAALAELLELLPVMIVSSRVASMALPSVLALMLGKALGAVLAALVGM